MVLGHMKPSPFMAYVKNYNAFVWQWKAEVFPPAASALFSFPNLNFPPQKPKVGPKMDNKKKKQQKMGGNKKEKSGSSVEKSAAARPQNTQKFADSLASSFSSDAAIID